MNLSLIYSAVLIFSGFAWQAYAQTDSDASRRRPNQPIGQMDKCTENPEVSCACLLGDDPSGPVDEERCLLGIKKYGINYPETFTLRQNFFVWNTRFDVETSSQKIGTISRNLSNPEIDYQFESEEGELLAVSRTQYYDWGAVADVYDGADNYLGWVQEQLSSWFSPSKFQIYNSEKKLVAEASMNFWGTKFYIQDPQDSNKLIATLRRPWFCFYKHHWTVEVNDLTAIAPHRIDPRLLIMIAVYQTENERMDKKELVLEYNSQLHPKQSSSNKAEMVPTELKTRLRLLSARLAEVALEVEHSSPDQIEEDEALAGLKHEIDLIPLPNRFESTPISYNDYKQNQEKGRWIQKIKTLEKGLELLGQEHLSPEKKAAILRLLKQLSRESVS